MMFGFVPAALAAATRHTTIPTANHHRHTRVTIPAPYRSPRPPARFTLYSPPSHGSPPRTIDDRTGPRRRHELPPRREPPGGRTRLPPDPRRLPRPPRRHPLPRRPRPPGRPQ